MEINCFCYCTEGFEIWNLLLLNILHHFNSFFVMATHFSFINAKRWTEILILIQLLKLFGYIICRGYACRAFKCTQHNQRNLTLGITHRLQTDVTKSFFMKSDIFHTWHILPHSGTFWYILAHSCKILFEFLYIQVWKYSFSAYLCFVWMIVLIFLSSSHLCVFHA